MAGLFFVHKTPSSQDLSKSSRSESAVMMSHVQTNRRRAEGHDQHKPWSAYVSVLTQPRTDNEGGESIEKKKKKKNIPVRGRSRALRLGAAAAATSGATDTPTTMQRSLSFPPSPVSRSFPSSNAYDPFHCTVIGTEAETHTLLRWAFFEVARTNFLAEAFAPNPRRIIQDNCHSSSSSSAPPRHQAIITARLQRCVHDELLMYATLAYSSSMLGWITGRFRDGEEAPEVFIGKAIPHLRSRIYIRPDAPRGQLQQQQQQQHQHQHQQDQCPVDDWLILSLYSLAITELWNGLPEMWARHVKRRSSMVREMAADSLRACRMHLRALVFLVTEAGGWHLFNPYILDSTLLADKFLAIASSQPPILGLTWDPGPTPPLRELRVELNNAALRHPLLGKRLLLEGPFSSTTVADTRLRATLRDLVEYCRVAQVIWARSDYVAAEVETWLFRRLQAIQMRLLLHFHDQTPLRHDDRCTSLAALVFIAVVIPSPGTKISAQYLSHSFRLTMTTMPPPSSSTDLQEYADDDDEDAEGEKDQNIQELRAWHVFICSLISKPFEDWEWFQEQIHSQSARLRYTDEAEFSRLMEEYLHLPSREGMI
ncbi:uncharacterized protein FOBCDRAFT_321299 [Fusarium oxysporum Fo47]|uniref:Uncharacterized protein n=1 Tax=Fusarium oxysporum Fo47 TaxID=660027 RepID=W9J9C0_FUSOX|nr:uncharacterized protein FOBCDRAFT_321299 [Fusarium oxysporum Fo47]EWZ28456.1 hypothetical protein FOZG_17849 [Fusarium oxysporum Fo47]QKD56953.1 hypothetical protein FOBCDRAFT_321299 [Fusarium oxysporum Fo47]